VLVYCQHSNRFGYLSDLPTGSLDERRAKCRGALLCTSLTVTDSSGVMFST
jgi:hypothetical protein